MLPSSVAKLQYEGFLYSPIFTDFPDEQTLVDNEDQLTNCEDPCWRQVAKKLDLKEKKLIVQAYTPTSSSEFFGVDKITERETVTFIDVVKFNQPTSISRCVKKRQFQVFSFPKEAARPVVCCITRQLDPTLTYDQKKRARDQEKSPRYPDFTLSSLMGKCLTKQ